MERMGYDITQYYEKLFTLGSLQKNIIRYSITFILSLIILLIPIFTSNVPVFLTLICFLSPLSLATDLYLFRKNERDKELYSLRRLLAINTVTNVIVIIGSLIFMPLIYMFKAVVYPASIIAGLIMSYRLVIFYSTSRQDLFIILLDVLSPVIVLISIYLYIAGAYFNVNLLSHEIFIMIIEPVVFGPLMALTFLYLINLKKGEATAHSVYDYLRGYVDSWVLDNPKPLDELLSEYSIDIKLDADIVIFPNTSPQPTIALFPYIHFGPFRNIGSSRFPAIAAEYYNLMKNMNAIVFHTPTTHELDLSSNEENFIILKQLDDIKQPYVFNTISDIHYYKQGRAAAYIIKMEKSVLLILETDEMEDIPYEVTRKLKEYGRELGYKNVIIVDAHNSLQRDKYVLPKDVVKDLLTVGEKALQKSLDIDVMPFKISSIKINIPGFTPKRGLGQNGVGILIWETFNGYNAIICFDSNNMSPYLKMGLQKYLKRLFNMRIVVVSTDTHEVTAVELNRRGYVLLGENKKDVDILTRFIAEAIEKALSLLKDDEGHIYSKKIKSRVLGINTIERMADIVTSSYEMMKKLMYTFVGPLVILHILLIYMYYITYIP